MPAYLQQLKAARNAVDPHRDRAQMLKVESVQQAWQQWINKLPPARREDDDVKEIRWMIEELRVSYFAQQLGTCLYLFPISVFLQAMGSITRRDLRLQSIPACLGNVCEEL